MISPPPVLPLKRRSSTRPSTPPCEPTSTHPARRHAVFLIAVAIIACTLLGVLAGALVPALGPGRAPHPTLHGTLAEALSIAVTNASSLAAPLLLTAGRWHTSPLTRRLGDVLVAAIIAVNALLIGLALGRHPIALLAYLPHLPLEDAALTTAAAAWVTRRAPSSAHQRPRSVAAYAAVTLALTVLAALMETYAIPHKG